MNKLQSCFIFALVLPILNTNCLITTYDNSLPTGFNISAFLLNLRYPIEVHQDVQTSDGYLLDLHRIPHGTNGTTNKRNNSVALMMAGIGMTSDGYVLGGPQQALALILADEGYDVWLADPRGSGHSVKHLTLSTQDPKYWNYSWHEIGMYDIPAIIDYILNYTNQSSLYYIGHSQGGTTFFVMTSSIPRMNKAIKLMIGLAPGAFYGISGLRLPNSFVSSLTSFLYNLFYNLGIYKVDYPLYQQVVKLLQHIPGVTRRMADVIIYTLSGVHNPLDMSQNGSRRTLSLMRITTPDSFSIKQVLHYIQLILTAQFQKYDYGKEENMHYYHQLDPPPYNLKGISAPVAIFYCLLDVYVTIFNTAKLIQTLPNVVYSELVPDIRFTHENMISHIDIRRLLYDRVLRVMNNYN